MSNLDHIYGILEELSRTTKSTEKKEILKKYKEDELWRKVIDYALDPFKMYGIKKIPGYFTGGDNFLLNNDSIFSSMDSLVSRELSGHAALDRISAILSEASNESGEVVKRIIQKDLKCGVAASTINSVYGKGTVFVYPCMLASKQDEKTMNNINYPAFVQTKFDGLRANVIINRDKVEVRTRSGKVLDVESRFFQLPQGRYVIDGELVVMGNDDKFLSRKKGNGILNKAQKGTISDKEREKVFMVAWDCIYLDDFLGGYSDEIYYNRLKILNSIILDSKSILLAKNYQVWNEEEALSIYRENISEGEEGIIIKNTDLPWEDKRSKNMVKMKEVKTADLRVSKVIEGDNKYAGRLGALLLTDDLNTIEVKVGTGFSDEQRESLWIDRDNIIDSIIEIQYNERISSKSKELDSLFLPVFVQLRDDKNTTNVD